MVSKSQLKLITSLQQKKHRKEQQLFFVEGKKVIQELLESNFEPVYLFATDVALQFQSKINLTIISSAELKKMSALATPNDCLAVFKIPFDTSEINGDLVMVLDDVKDPGNLGTIIRLCDWFGIQELICSNETVDVYNPKVLQATMGSIARVSVRYCDLKDFLSKTKLPVFGTFMDGTNIYKSALPQKAVIVMGNEANGISTSIEKLISQKLAIPRFGSVQKTESLNVATAAGIVLSEFRRAT